MVLSTGAIIIIPLSFIIYYKHYTLLDNCIDRKKHFFTTSNLFNYFWQGHTISVIVQLWSMSLVNCAAVVIECEGWPSNSTTPPPPLYVEEPIAHNLQKSLHKDVLTEVLFPIHYWPLRNEQSTIMTEAMFAEECFWGWKNKFILVIPVGLDTQPTQHQSIASE